MVDSQYTYGFTCDKEDVISWLGTDRVCVHISRPVGGQIANQ